MSITVVIPAFNAEETVRDTVVSLRQQTYRGWRAVIVNDGSADRTEHILSGFQDDNISTVSQANAGVSAARNRGLADVTTEYVLFLDADDMLHPEALARLLGAAQSNPDAIGVFGGTRYVGPSGTTTETDRVEGTEAAFQGNILEHMIKKDRVFWNSGQVLIKTSAVRSCSGYNHALRLSEDWEFFCRLTSLGEFVRLAAGPEVLRHRVRPTTASPTLAKDWNNQIPALDAVFSNPALQARFPPRKWASMRRTITAVQMFNAGRLNFTNRRFAAAWPLMLRATAISPSRKRFAMLALALGSQALNRTLHPRLAFLRSPRRV